MCGWLVGCLALSDWPVEEVEEMWIFANRTSTTLPPLLRHCCEQHIHAHTHTTTDTHTHRHRHWLPLRLGFVAPMLSGVRRLLYPADWLSYFLTGSLDIARRFLMLPENRLSSRKSIFDSETFFSSSTLLDPIPYFLENQFFLFAISALFCRLLFAGF